MVKTLLKMTTGMAIAAAAFASTAASAATILTFGQVGTGLTFNASNPTSSSTALTASDVAVTITGLENGVTPQTAYFTFNALSTGAAGTLAGQFYQNFAGTFSIYSGLAKTGTNLLSGSYNDLALAIGNTQTTSFTSGTAATFGYSSDVISSLAAPMSFTLSLTSVTPDLNIQNGTLGAFSASVSGNFSGSAVPEPASWALMVGGFGMLGATMRRRKPTTVVSFG